MPPVPQPPEGGDAPEEGAAPATPDTPEVAAPPDFDRIYARMDEMSSQQQQMAEQLGQVAQWATPEEEEPDYYDETGELTEEGVREVYNQHARQTAEEIVEQRLSERERREAIEDRDLDWIDLQDRIPELRDPQYSREIIAEAADLVGHNEAVIEHPRFVDIIERVHAHRKFAEHAAAETPAQEGRQVVLESAQGAAQPTKGSDDVDWGDRIVKAAERLRPQL